MRKLECACGISIDIYSWPPTEIEQNGKKMMERHISCRCTREIVVRTAPKYEPDAEVKEGEKIATVVSFAELSRQCGVLKETEPYNKPAAGGLDEDEEDAAPADKGSVTLPEDQCKLLNQLVMNYANWFKQGKASAKEQKKFFEFAAKLKPNEAISVNDEESRMCKMAISERNLFHIYGEEMSDEDKAAVGAVVSTLKTVIS